MSGVASGNRTIGIADDLVVCPGPTGLVFVGLPVGRWRVKLHRSEDGPKPFKEGECTISPWMGGYGWLPAEQC